VAPEVARLEGMHLYNIDQLEEVVAANRGCREEHAEHARELAGELARKTFAAAAKMARTHSGASR
jgi:glutamyl-tRNA reductase